MTAITCEFSSADFGGFQVELPVAFVEQLSTIAALTDVCVHDLRTVLTLNSFKELLPRVERQKFHIHTQTTLAQILEKPSEIVYICECTQQ
jgi:hypothetical protein